jgi:hypothetical protein
MGACSALGDATSYVANAINSSIVAWSPGLIILKTTLPPSQTYPVGFTMTNNDTGQTANYCLANGSLSGCASSVYSICSKRTGPGEESPNSVSAARDYPPPSTSE